MSLSPLLVLETDIEIEQNTQFSGRQSLYFKIVFFDLGTHNPYCYFEEGNKNYLVIESLDKGMTLNSLTFTRSPNTDDSLTCYTASHCGITYFIYTRDNLKHSHFCKSEVKDNNDLIFNHSLFDIFAEIFFESDRYRAAFYFHDHYNFLKKTSVAPEFTHCRKGSTPKNRLESDPVIKSKAYGDVEWQTFKSCLEQNLFTQDGIPTGGFATDKHDDFYQINYSGDKHLITIAPNGSGKGSCVQIPALLDYKGSMLVIDPKGENAAVTAKYRKEELGQKVFILNPFCVLEDTFTELGFTPNAGTFKPHGFNPLSMLSRNNPSFVSDVLSLCEILVDSESTGNADSFWNDSARELIACIIMFVCITESHDSEKRNLGEVRKILTLPEKELINLLSNIAGVEDGADLSAGNNDAKEDDSDENDDDTKEEIFSNADDDVGDYESTPDKPLFTGRESAYLGHKGKYDSIDYPPLRQKAAFFTGSSKAIQSIISTALTQTNFLDDPILAKNLSQDDIDFAKLKKESITVYLILPAHLIITYSKWFKLLVNSALNQLMSTHEQGEKTVLMMLDECATLGRLKSLEGAIGLARGFGVQLWTFWQDIHQLNHIYGNRKESFLANSGVQQYFTPNDTEIAKRISERLGKTTSYSVSMNESKNLNKTTNKIESSQSSVSTNEVAVDFMPTTELFSLEANKQLMFLYGNKEGILAEKIPYYKNLLLKDRAANNPYIRS